MSPIYFDLQKINNLSADNDSCYYPVVANPGKVTFAQLSDQIAHANTCTKADIEGVVSALVEAIVSHLSSGSRVEVKGLGSFYVKPTCDIPIRYTDDKNIARHIRVGQINFMPAKTLLTALEQVKFHRTSHPAPQRPTHTDEEIMALWQQYVEQSGERLVTRRAFQKFTGYSRTHAIVTLRRLTSEGLIVKGGLPNSPYYRLKPTDSVG